MEIPLSTAVIAAKTTLWQSKEAIYLKSFPVLSLLSFQHEHYFSNNSSLAFSPIHLTLHLQSDQISLYRNVNICNVSTKVKIDKLKENLPGKVEEYTFND